MNFESIVHPIEEAKANKSSAQALAIFHKRRLFDIWSKGCPLRDHSLWPAEGRNMVFPYLSDGTKQHCERHAPLGCWDMQSDGQHILVFATDQIRENDTPVFLEAARQWNLNNHSRAGAIS